MVTTALELAVPSTLPARVLQMHPSPALFCQEALTPPSRLALSPSGPGVAAGAEDHQGDRL
jgi:hypothetical protein